MTDNLPVKYEWEKGFVTDYAMNVASEVSGVPLYDRKDLMAFWGYTEEQYNVIVRDPEFIKAYRAELKVIKENAPHLRKKAELLLENWLNNQAPDWLNDQDASIAERNKVLESVMKLSGISEKGKVSDDGGSGPVVPSVNIILNQPSQISVEKQII